MTTPLLSVVLPVRNGEPYLAAAVASILAQTFTDFELVVSDNASTDATPQILADFASRDPRVRVSRLETLIPAIDNFNRAVGLALGTWVKFMCHDDLMRPDCLAEIVAVLADADQRHVGLVGNGECQLFANGYLAEGSTAVAPVHLSGRDAVAGALSSAPGFSIPALTTATVRKAAFEEAGGIDGRYLHLGDNFCWMEVLARWNYVYLPMPLTTNRIHERQAAVTLGPAMVSTMDLAGFLPSYVERHGKALGLSRSVRLRAWLRPMSEAATKVTAEWLAGRRRNIVGMLRRLPPHWLPLLVPLSLRALRKHRQRKEALSPHVPTSMIYP